MRTGRAPLVIVAVGAESTGKTMLAEALASRFGAPLVPEVAREYLAGCTSYDRDDVREIARRQLEAERRALAADSELVIADTDLVVIRIWWEERFGPFDPPLEARLANELAKGNRRYLVPTPDVPWVADPLRENPHDRPRLHARYLALLRDYGAELVEICGHGTARNAAAHAAVKAWREAWTR